MRRIDRWSDATTSAIFRQRANEMAAEIDSAPCAYLTLVRATHNCRCGAPFNLDATPNFAQRLEDASLPWPPRSPIKWPLKDWSSREMWEDFHPFERCVRL